jgi:hypothetical protein
MNVFHAQQACELLLLEDDETGRKVTGCITLRIIGWATLDRTVFPITPFGVESSAPGSSASSTAQKSSPPMASATEMPTAGSLSNLTNLANQPPTGRGPLERTADLPFRPCSRYA